MSQERVLQLILFLRRRTAGKGNRCLERRREREARMTQAIVERSGRTSDSQLRGPGFESCAAVLKPWIVFSLCTAPVNSAV